MPAPRFILILEDSESRITGFKQAVAQLDEPYELKIWNDAPSMIAECEQFFPKAALISLDHDLNPQPGAVAHPGTGMDVAQFLADFLPVCPVLIHTSDTNRAYSMQNELRFAKWMVNRVEPVGISWIEATWMKRVRELLAEYPNTWKINHPSDHSARVERMRLSLEALGIGDALGEMLNYRYFDAPKRLAENDLPAGPWLRHHDAHPNARTHRRGKMAGDIRQSFRRKRFHGQWRRHARRSVGRLFCW
jgi:hypothetical protein